MFIELNPHEKCNSLNHILLQTNEYTRAILELGGAFSPLNVGRETCAFGFGAKSCGKRSLPDCFPLDAKSGKSQFSGIHVS